MYDIAELDLDIKVFIIDGTVVSRNGIYLSVVDSVGNYCIDGEC